MHKLVAVTNLFNDVQLWCSCGVVVYDSRGAILMPLALEIQTHIRDRNNEEVKQVGSTDER